ncbi:ShlB/FhaC/HecB family hemolysin secretion/activation protein [Herbaspirillum huttiense F1]|uniref:ShlB/FhaC/HecB family hemolysin secretion/activation protein n=1 Tax=Herbaspirillum huttiense subsp. lycopersici TaxID=3074428 RepID=A0ABU2EP42_9BURK|nr:MULTISPECIES: ShlB/FhaC/HecB family hemolysin secretion/activation protein [Herbaspirillum]MBP1314642.1 hemolysin activation/secretion protein [Herbaspirillum sp. 1130]MDR9849940.1 ShlB/FhaC/HecB family hemolysin secretion/activation protein [Herbaspirillum huttiense SE1]MDT0358720.1 ShlB/FhaC/HecB family hemolysin secretion/activation protein [Herbaspirillum huttiense F1]
MKRCFGHSLIGMALLGSAVAAWAQPQPAPQASAVAAGSAPVRNDERFDITRFAVEGNTLLTQARVDEAVTPFRGPGRVYGDIQQALEALENAYRSAGYTAVQVSVPEQELTGGVVRLQVVETVVGKVVVSDNRHFSEQNIRASIPQLVEGSAPNLRRISESVQLANDNPAKQVNVTLTASESTNQIDAAITVKDDNPLRVMLNVDNSGNRDTGQWRTGVAVQHSNLFNRDHVATVAYTTSPDSPSGAKVDLYSLGYRLPMYGLGDSLDFIYGKSNVTSGQTLAVNSTLNITGRGEIYALRWNHYFARSGEWSSKLVFGADYKKVDSSCNINGGLLNGASLNTCLPYSTLPLSVSYSAQQQGVGQVLDYNLGIARNMATGEARRNDALQVTDRYSLFTGSRQSMDNFIIVRGGASWFKVFQNDWQVRLASSLQVSPHALPPVEQFGLAGANTVRGFTERAVAADSGAVVNAELYTPDLLVKSEARGNLRLLGFVDAARGANNNVTAASTVPSTLTLASFGAGLRYTLGRDFTLRLDVARVLLNGNSVTEQRGDLNAHLSAILGF